jgi:hypothetical protein
MTTPTDVRVVMFATVFHLARQFRGNVNGVASIELALLSPLLILMAVATIDLGAAIYASMQVRNAAHAGAHQATLKGFDTNVISKAVEGASRYIPINAAPFPTQFCGCVIDAIIEKATCKSLCPNGATAGHYVLISAQANYTPLLPYPLIPKQFSFLAQSKVRIP